MSFTAAGGRKSADIVGAINAAVASAVGQGAEACPLGAQVGD